MPATDPVQHQRAIAWAAQQERRARSPWSGLFVRLHRLRPLGPMVRRVFLKLEGGEVFSATLREVLRGQFGVTVGKYSYGPSLEPGVLPRGTVVGNYCSLAEGLLVFRRNHPGDRLSLHPFFFNQTSGVLAMDSIGGVEENPLVIGHDVWIGARAIILPRCKSIGTGAVVGAGSVVTRDVPAFAMVAGNPARVIAGRFSKEVQETVQASEWWLRPLPALLEDLSLFTVAAAGVAPEVLARFAAKNGG